MGTLRPTYGSLSSVQKALVRPDMPTYVCGLWVYNSCFYSVAIVVLLTVVIANSVVIGLQENRSSPTLALVDPICPVSFSEYRYPHLLNEHQYEQMKVLFNGDQCKAITNIGYKTLLGIVHAISFNVNLTHEIGAYIFPEYDPNVTSYTCTNDSSVNISTCKLDGAASMPNKTANCVLDATLASIKGQQMKLCFKSLDTMAEYIEREFLISFALGCKGSFHIMYDSLDPEAHCITYAYRTMQLSDYDMTIVPIGKPERVPNNDTFGRRLDSTWTINVDVGIDGFLNGLKDYNWVRETALTFSEWRTAYESGLSQKPTVPPPHLMQERSYAVRQTIDGLTFDASMEFEMFWWYRVVNVGGVTNENNLTYVRFLGNLSVTANSPEASAQLPIWDALSLNLHDVLFLVTVKASVGLTMGVQLHGKVAVSFAIQADAFTSSLFTTDSKHPVMGAALSGSASATADARATLAIPIIVSAYVELAALLKVADEVLSDIPVVGTLVGLVHDFTHLCYGVALVPYVQVEFVEVAEVKASVKWGGPSDPRPALATRTCGGAQTKVCAQAGASLWMLQQWQYEFLWWGGDLGKGSLTRLMNSVFWPTTCWDLEETADACKTETLIKPVDFTTWARADMCPPKAPKLDASFILGKLSNVAKRIRL